MTTAEPENNKANKSIIDILSNFFKTNKTKIKITKGFCCKNKIIEIDATYFNEKYLLG